MQYGVVQFGEYVFPATVAEFYTNFGDVQPKTLKIPSMDGALNLDGDGPAVTETGKVTVGFTLIAESRGEMQAKRDAVRALVDAGKQRLWWKPPDYPTNDRRWCWALVNFITMSERQDQHTDLWQKVQIIFQAPEPRWQDASYSWTLGDGSEIGQAGLLIGEGPKSQSASGTSGSFTVTNAGSAKAVAHVTVEPAAGQSCQNPKIQRVVDGIAVDEFQYTGTVAALSILDVDGKAQRATLDGAPIWDDFTYKHPDFLRLEAGDNTITWSFANAGDAATIRVYFFSAWR